MILDQETLAYNKAALDKYVQDESSAAQLLKRREGLIYVYPLNYEEMCRECSRVADGKIYLLYDGRTKKRFKLPQVPNPLCEKPALDEDRMECRLLWWNIDPSRFYLKRERRFLKQFSREIEEWNRKIEAERGSDRQGPFYDTWSESRRSSNHVEWAEWIATHSNIEFYNPPLL
jgi:hypothetical protein